MTKPKRDTTKDQTDTQSTDDRDVSDDDRRLMEQAARNAGHDVPTTSGDYDQPEGDDTK